MKNTWIPHKWVSQNRNKPRRIKAGVELGDRYKGPDGHVYLIEEMHGGLVAINMSSLQTEFIHTIDWSKMEKMHD